VKRRRLQWSLPFEEIIDLVRFGIHRDQLRDWLAALRDYDGFVLSLDLVHDRETVCFEGACWHLLHRNPVTTMVIISWSSIQKLKLEARIQQRL
jgi:hypothetical protein